MCNTLPHDEEIYFFCKLIDKFGHIIRNVLQKSYRYKYDFQNRQKEMNFFVVVVVPFIFRILVRYETFITRA